MLLLIACNTQFNYAEHLKRLIGWMPPSWKAAERGKDVQHPLYKHPL